MPTKKPVVQVVLDEEALKKLDEIAASEGRTRSNIVAYIIRKYLDDYTANQNQESLKSQTLENKHMIS